MIQGNIYFIRHKFSTSEFMNGFLENEKLISIHFNNEEKRKWMAFSKKSRKSRGFKQAWKCFEELQNYGGIVQAEYNPQYQLVGEVRAGSKIKYSKKLRAKKYYGYKTLKLAKVKKIYYCDFPILSVIRPRPTISPVSKRNHPIVLHVYKGHKLPISLAYMTPVIQEQLCEEWLRSKFCPSKWRLKHLLLRLGKDMKAVDIYGKTQADKKLFAQVTFHSNSKKIQKKITALNSFAGKKNIKLMFSNLEDTLHSKNNVHFISLSKVWNDFYKHKKSRKMLVEMIRGG